MIFKGFTIFRENWEGPQPVILAIAYSPCGILFTVKPVCLLQAPDSSGLTVCEAAGDAAAQRGLRKANGLHDSIVDPKQGK